MTTDNGEQEQQSKWTLTPYENNWWNFENEIEEIAFGIEGGTPQQRQRYLDYLNALEAQAAQAQRLREALEEADLRFSVIHNRANDFSDSYDEGDLAVIDLESIRQLAVAAREDIAARLRALAPRDGQEEGAK